MGGLWGLGVRTSTLTNKRTKSQSSLANRYNRLNRVTQRKFSLTTIHRLSPLTLHGVLTAAPGTASAPPRLWA